MISPLSKEQARERSIKALMDSVETVMARAGVDRAELAKRLGKSRSAIDKIFATPGDITLPALGSILWACNVEVDDLKTAPFDALTFETTANGTSAATYLPATTPEQGKESATKGPLDIAAIRALVRDVERAADQMWKIHAGVPAEKAWSDRDAARTALDDALSTAIAEREEMRGGVEGPWRYCNDCGERMVWDSSTRECPVWMCPRHVLIRADDATAKVTALESQLSTSQERVRELERLAQAVVHSPLIIRDKSVTVGYSDYEDLRAALSPDTQRETT